MKKIFTLIAVLGIISGAAVKAQDFPSDPGELMVDLTLYAADIEIQEDSIPGYAPLGGGVYNAGTTVEISAREIPGYTFVTWSDQEQAQTRQITVNESMTLAAHYQYDQYLITFLNDDSTVVTSGHYHYGDPLTEPDAPYKENTAQYTYNFIGWSPEVTTVTAPQTYVAVWDTIVNKYAVKFRNWNGEELQSDSIEYGVVPQYSGDQPTRPTEDGIEYTFSGWDPEPVAVIADAEYFAQFNTQEIDFIVHFIQYEQDSVILAHYNDQLELLAVPAESDYFVQWSDGEIDNPRLVNIVSDTTFTAQFEINRYDIAFFNWDETVLQRDTLDYGTMPQFRGEEPTRPEDQGIRYTFSGWFPTLEVATSNAYYTAQFTPENIEYNVLVVLDGDTSVYTYYYGNEVSLSAPDNNDRHFLRWTDGETSAERTVIIVSDTLFSAEYGDSFVAINIAANQWNFICLPTRYDNNAWDESDFNISELANVSWGTYNGAVRAEAKSGWEATESFVAQRGYILYSAIAGRLRLNTYPELLDQSYLTTTLSAFEAAYPENANWNFVGNPLTIEAGADRIEVTGTDEPTATVWNGTGYDNMLISSADFKLQPLQAFFIQTAGAGSIAFSGNGNSNPAPLRAPQVEENSRIDIEATAAGYTDKTRVIFRSNSSVRYEAGRDASKFVTATAPIQMYFLDVDNVKCAQMVRPAGDDDMRLAYMLLNPGTININMPVYAEQYELYDALTGQYYDLSETVSIYSEKGTFNNRLSLRPSRKVPTGISNTANEVVATKVIINDQLYLIRDGKMYSVEGQLVR